MATAAPDIATQIYFLGEDESGHARRSLDFARLEVRFRDHGERLSSHTTSEVELVRIAFRGAGVVGSDEEIDSHVVQHQPAFKERAKGHSTREQRAMFGTTIHRDASIRAAFTGLRDLIDDYHGGALDWLVQRAEFLGYYVIENSEPTITETSGQSVSESA